MSDSADTKAYELWVQGKIIRKKLSEELTGEIKFKKINVELCYLQGYIDGMADSGQLSYLRYERLQKLIEAHIERNRKAGEEAEGEMKLIKMNSSEEGDWSETTFEKEKETIALYYKDLEKVKKDLKNGFVIRTDKILMLPKMVFQKIFEGIKKQGGD